MMSMEIKSEANSGLITRDFLGGGCFGVESKELDLDLHVPSGWEKRLDLKSGKVFLQRCNPAYTANEQRNAANKMSPKHHDLNTNFLQSSSTYSIKQSTTLGLLEHPSLDLKLVSNNNSPTSYTSVCTLDKVKSALDRAERASPTTSSSSSSSKKRLLMMSTPSPSNNSSVSDERDPLSNQNAGLLVAAACPGCLLYVLISKNDPKCPKCSSLVNLPVLSKKPKIDLNISI